jgi:hypothetical protein
MLVATRYATHQEIEFKGQRLHSKGWSLFIIRRNVVNIGHFYYLKDQYFIDFPDPMLMQNKETIDDQVHDRPCFFTFQDTNTGIYWMIPFSSRVNKFVGIYDRKIQKYGKCDTIVFGDVLGRRKAFLIQNMCPITPKYIKNEYIDGAANIPVRISGALEKELTDKAKRVLALQRKGIPLIFPDVLKIEKELLSQSNQSVSDT